MLIPIHIKMVRTITMLSSSLCVRQRAISNSAKLCLQWQGHIHIQERWFQSPLFSLPQGSMDPQWRGGSKPLLENKGKPFDLVVGTVEGHFISNYKFHISLKKEFNNMNLVLVWQSNKKKSDSLIHTPHSIPHQCGLRSLCQDLDCASEVTAITILKSCF